MREPRNAVEQLAFDLLVRHGLEGAADRLFHAATDASMDPQVLDAAVWNYREQLEREIVTLEIPASKILDLRPLESIPLRIVGNSYWVTSDERKRYGGSLYVLVREPDHEHDPNAVAVFGKQRKVGYLPAGRARMLAPHLDELRSPAFKIAGEGLRGFKLTVHVPTIPALRQLARSH